MMAAHGDRSRPRGGDPASAPRRELVDRHHRAAVAHPPQRGAPGARAGRRGVACAAASWLDDRRLQGVHHRDADPLPGPAGEPSVCDGARARLPRLGAITSATGWRCCDRARRRKPIFGCGPCPVSRREVDWAHFGTMRIGRAQRPLMAFVMVLSYSRMMFLRFYLAAAMGCVHPWPCRRLPGAGGRAHPALRQPQECGARARWRCHPVPPDPARTRGPLPLPTAAGGGGAGQREGLRWSVRSAMCARTSLPPGPTATSTT